MDRDTLQTSVIEYFESKGTVPGPDVKSKLAVNYLDQQIIDSMGIVELVSDFETNYGIQFTAEDLQSPEFQTIGGLVEIVAARGGAS